MRPAAPHRARRWARRAAVLLGALLVLCGIGTAWAYPPLGAAVCPACYGFERVSAELVLPRDPDPALAEALAADLAGARERIAATLGPSRARTVFIGCPDERCHRRMGGKGARATTYSTPLGSVVRVSPRGLNGTILTHELAHAAIHERIGVSRLLSGALPAWFDEGLAVIVSDDARYLGPGRGGERCVDPPDGPLPASPFEWASLGGRDPHLYARAACAVLAWMDEAGGWPAIRTALDEVGAGERRLP